ncbi:MAG: HlyC/CorC family transporter [Planctomycetes bacterium]|nr:HlyC/CorC family transporter [Planctomycetota bacterium]
MYIAVGLALLGLTLYISTLSYTLRAYSRSRLSERFSGANQQKWVDWLHRNVTRLQLAASAIRVLLNLAFMLCALAWQFDGRPAEAILPGALLPALAAFLLLIVFAVGIPHALALHAGESILARSVWLLRGVRWVLGPIVWVLLGVDFVVRRLLGKADETREQESERVEQEILEAVSEGEAHGAVDEDAKEMIESVIELHETTVDAIMTPRTEMVTIPADADFAKVRATILEAGHSRVPVYESTVDHIIGVLYAKDLIGLDPNESFDTRTIIRSVPYVPETKNIDHLLREFRQNKVHIAIVLDEYGGTAGLVTIEDIIEEVIGEIDDEYDRQAPEPIDHIDEDTLEVDARVHVEEINEELRVTLPEDEDYETIGGFVFSTLGKIPATGEEFTHENIHFQIVAAEPRKINRLRIHVERAAKQSA